jgi:hypothetical protein
VGGLNGGCGRSRIYGVYMRLDLAHLGYLLIEDVVELERCASHVDAPRRPPSWPLGIVFLFLVGTRPRPTPLS